MPDLTPKELTKARGCACLETIRQQLEAQLKTEVDLQLGAFLLTSKDAENWPTYTDFPPLKYKFKEKKKVHTGTLMFRFCPFCGKKKA